MSEISKRVAKEFANMNKRAREARQNATTGLSPDLLRRAIKSGNVSPQMEVLIGKKADGSAFSAEDLKGFAKKRDQVNRRSTTEGVSIDQLISASRPDDIKRANGTYKPKTPDGWVGNLSRGSATLYKVNNSIMIFAVKASGDGPNTRYQTRVKLMDWETQLANPNANDLTATKNALNGKIKIDCNCKRHQFWYRYLAGVGKYALTPPIEKDFPKIKNPGLTGAVCKHVVAVFQVIRTPTYQNLISKKMAEQRMITGFGTKKGSSTLRRSEIDALKKSRPRKTDQAKYQAKIQNAMKKVLATKKAKTDLKREVKKLEARKVKLEKQLSQKDAEIAALKKGRQALGRKTKENIKGTLSEMVKSVANEQGITETEAAAFIVSQLSSRSEE